MTSTGAQDTHRKALQINLDPLVYGTIAEIGAGQEVARWFFRAGGASGTIAKTMSAYDMQFSDEIYGSARRYVSRERLEKMLDREYTLLLKRLDQVRGKDTAFFVFADSVAARNYEGSNIPHGWVGMRFQAEPAAEPNTIVLHVHMNDPSSLAQQEALGVLGVNLIYAALYLRDSQDEFLSSLIDELSIERVEIDFIELGGPAFETIDNRLLGLKLLAGRLANAVLYSPGGEVDEPHDVLYKRPVVILRGAFRVDRPLYMHMLQAAIQHLEMEEGPFQRSPAGVYEISLNNLLEVGTPADSPLLARIDRLLTTDNCVLVSNFAETYHLTDYLRAFTNQPIRFAMGISSLIYLFYEAYYEALEGGIMEAFGKLIRRGVRLYVFPMPAQRLRERLGSTGYDPFGWHIPESGIANIENSYPLGSLRHLYEYLKEIGAIHAVGETD